MRKKTNHDNDTNQKHDITYDRPDQTGNNYGNHEHVYIESEHQVDYDRSYNSGNHERALMPSEPPVDYDRRK